MYLIPSCKANFEDTSSAPAVPKAAGNRAGYAKPAPPGGRFSSSQEKVTGLTEANYLHVNIFINELYAPSPGVEHFGVCGSRSPSTAFANTSSQRIDVPDLCSLMSSDE